MITLKILVGIMRNQGGYYQMNGGPIKDLLLSHQTLQAMFPAIQPILELQLRF